MAYDKKTFLKEITVFCDTAEQENSHIIDAFDHMKIKHKDMNLIFGDYTFCDKDRDFSLSCVVERKANPDEFYGNITQDRERIEREFIAGSTISNEFTLLIENCADMESLNQYEIPDWKMKALPQLKVKNIGAICYSTIQSWQSANRYNFKTIFVPDNANTAAKILENFYWYWRNFKILTANRRNIRRKNK